MPQFGYDRIFKEYDSLIILLGIDWRIPVEKALLSEKDTKHALLKDFDSPFSIEMNLYPEFD